ncbi:MAG: peptide-methionine (S)-S-oxide reductase [Cyanobacteriota bacterium erpe_2018_sw_21hr_WHONDRS-SW48-000092_B_bin.40]|jgi:peptide-methionine (S)-S-oxide reductase|nr:peptide-methionine (S)-S-oxide reductase [Cyanobacteriota bacterium erpe_2018_sw_21hr_WHONDRS-SW48-000092_B_bin.40]
MEKATFGAGCFWGVEEKFRQTKGVVETKVGYSGGHTENPTYEQVCGKQTGHAEVVEVTFDPAVISYEQLLKIFFEMHDPTTLNRQGPDHGSQYRSAVYFHSAEQEQQAKEMIAALTTAKAFRDPIVTEVTAAKPFYDAEEYHQKYLAKRGINVCH